MTASALFLGSSAAPRRWWLPWLVGACSAGCAANLVKSVDLVANQSPAVGTPVAFVVSGSGTCSGLSVDWGDAGTQQISRAIDFGDASTADQTFDHIFVGWGGGKTVTVTGVGCEGTARTRFDMTPSPLRLGFAQPGTDVCAMPANNSLPGLARGWLVTVTAVPIATPPYDRGINFGCPFSNCVYDADGRTGSVANGSYPFPGLREYSLVLRVGQSVFQGGSNARFTTTGSGRLEFCLNDADNNATNNLGGFDVTVAVDQLGP